MNKSQEHYVSGNLEVLSDERLAEDTGLKVAEIRKFRKARKDERAAYDAAYKAAVERGEPAPDAMFRMKGAVAMTPEAADRNTEISQGGEITQDMINKASASGDYQLAATLDRQRKDNVRDRETLERARTSDRWHRIRD